MQHYNPTLNNRLRFPNSKQDVFKDRYFEQSYFGSTLPKQIIPRQPAAHMLRQMAYKASQKYDKVSDDVHTPTADLKPIKRTTEHPSAQGRQDWAGQAEPKKGFRTYARTQPWPGIQTCRR